MKPSYDIRPAQPQDAPILHAIAAAAYGKYTARIGKPPAPMNADFAGHIARAEAWVITQRGTVAGYVICFEKHRAFELDNIAVDAAHTGQGLGRALITHVEDLARAKGLAAVTLYTNAHMTENLALYPYLGFAETDRRHDQGYDRVFFRKELD